MEYIPTDVWKRPALIIWIKLWCWSLAPLDRDASLIRWGELLTNCIISSSSAVKTLGDILPSLSINTSKELPRLLLTICTTSMAKIRFFLSTGDAEILIDLSLLAHILTDLNRHTPGSAWSLLSSVLLSVFLYKSVPFHFWCFPFFLILLPSSRSPW